MPIEKKDVADSTQTETFNGLNPEEITDIDAKKRTEKDTRTEKEIREMLGDDVNVFMDKINTNPKWARENSQIIDKALDENIKIYEKAQAERDDNLWNKGVSGKATFIAASLTRSAAYITNSGFDSGGLGKLQRAKGALAKLVNQ